MCVLVTGANRGLGKTICLSAASKLQPGSVLVLLGRSEEGLKFTQEEILKLNSSIAVYVYAQFECANLDCESLTNYLKGLRLPESVSDLLIVHNAGTVGDPSQSCLSLSLQTASDYMTLNFTSAVAANSVFLDVYKSLSNKTVVNISSLCGILATKSLTLYCAGELRPFKSVLPYSYICALWKFSVTLDWKAVGIVACVVGQKVTWERVAWRVFSFV